MLSAAEWDAVRLSLLVATAATLGALPPAVAAAWWMARREFRGKALVETAINLPLVLPPVVTGYLLLVLFGARGPIGRWMEEWLGVRMVFTWGGAALAAGVVAFPLMVRAMRVAFQGVDARLEGAARTLGSRPLTVFFTVTLPLAWHGVVAAGVLGFARAIGEFGATIMIAGSIPGQTRTMPLYIYAAVESPDGMARAARMVVVAVVVAAAALLAGEILDRRARRRPPALHS